MNKAGWICVGFGLFMFGCNGTEGNLSENSSTLIFSSSWQESAVFAKAKYLYVFEGHERGYADIGKLKKKCNLLSKVEGRALVEGITIMRKIISMEGVSPKLMKPQFQIVVTKEDGSHLAYWEIRSWEEEGEEASTYVAVFPTGGLYRVNKIEEFLNYARSTERERGQSTRVSASDIL